MCSRDSVIRALKRVIELKYPIELAAKWDNTGIILEAPFERKNAKDVLVTVDLTEAVASEAISKPNIAAIVAYHPPIFRSIKSITLANPQQRSLLNLATSGISVYSPHTSVDAVNPGINDWLVDMISAHSGKSVIEPVSVNKADAEPAGYGRVAKLVNSMRISEIVTKIKHSLNLQTVQLAGAEIGDKRDILSVAVCVGSGGSILTPGIADLYVTGELSHHEILAIIQQGGVVILCNHSNTERMYLSTVFCKTLQESLDDATVFFSEQDRDPILYV